MAVKSTKIPPKRSSRKPAAKSAAAPAAKGAPATKSAPALAQSGGSVAVGQGATPDTEKVKRGEFVARVATRAGLRPNQVKPVLEAVLAELGDLLVKGEALNHPALGKISVNRHKDLEKADVMVCKLRRLKPEAPATASDPFSTAAE